MFRESDSIEVGDLIFCFGGPKDREWQVQRGIYLVVSVERRGYNKIGFVLDRSPWAKLRLRNKKGIVFRVPCTDFEVIKR
jgi:hypothetical protein